MLFGALVLVYAALRALGAGTWRNLGWRVGPELFLVGLLVGPTLELVQPDALDQAALAATAGVGLLLGLRLDLRRLHALEAQALRFAATHLGVVLLLGLGGWALARWLSDALALRALSLAVIPTVVALVLASDHHVLDRLAARFKVRGEAFAFTRRVATVTGLLAVLVHALGPALATGMAAPVQPAWAFWLVATGGLGLVAGGLGVLVLSPGLSRGQAVVALLATVLAIAAAAAELQLSGLAMGAIAGLVVASSRGPSALPELYDGDLDDLLAALLYFYVGVHWTYGGSLAVLLLVPLLLLGRVLIRSVSLGVAQRMSRQARPLPAISTALWSTGGLGVALLAELLHTWPAETTFLAEVYTVIAFAVAGTEAAAYGRTRRWLLDWKATRLPAREST